MSDSDVMIRVEGLGKKYAIHHEKAERYTALRDVVARQARAAGRLLNPFTLAGQLRKAQREAAQERAESEEEFWALKDVSFEIRRGERVGIIGRNGAGKSTLLKILSRITEPTTGRVEIRGRVASLLEVGTGFHPELTGRENIYLNGAILGMTRREIRSKFDEIVDFAEVEKFLDTPVKRYSSGMYVRLAFAVAAHLEPEILVVDEVLAVGDASFQNKCLGKMKRIAHEETRTILFVSHNMQSISALCSNAIVLSEGKISFVGNQDQAIQQYENGFVEAKYQDQFALSKPNKGTGVIEFVDAQVLCASQSAISTGEDVRIRMCVNNTSDSTVRDVVFAVDIHDDRDVLLLMQRSNFTGQIFSINPGVSTVVCQIPRLPLCHGRYWISLYCATDNESTLDYVQKALMISVLPGNFFGFGSSGMPQYCKVLNDQAWFVEHPRQDHGVA